MPDEGRPLRLGNKSFENVVRTDERYGHDGLWLGPRGRDYGALLEHPKPYQIANLYPDQNSSYWIATIQLPPVSALVLRGRYPYARYFQFALYRPDPGMGSFTATSEAAMDNEIQPDEGSANPFVPGAPRLGEHRDYTLRIVAEDAPARKEDRKPNTLYAGKDGYVQMVYRVYLPDVNRDGSGDVGLPKYEAVLADGTKLSADAVRQQLNRPMTGGVASGMTLEQWLALVHAPDNDPDLKPESSPARNPPVVERYFNNQYNLIGVFKPEKVRAKMSGKAETGFGGNPATLFMFAFSSRAFGPVLVIRGKMPVFPDTFMGDNGKGLETMTDWECRYWSVIQSEAPPSGKGADALTDMQVPLDEEPQLHHRRVSSGGPPRECHRRERRSVVGLGNPRGRARRSGQPHRLRLPRVSVHVQQSQVEAQSEHDHCARNRGRGDGAVLPTGRVYRQSDVRGNRTANMNIPKLTSNERPRTDRFRAT